MIRALAGALLLLAGCSHPGRPNVCAEYRDLSCLTEIECALDRARGCEVCRCKPPVMGDDQGRMPAPAPPAGEEPR